MSSTNENAQLPTQEYLADLWKEYQDYFETEDDFRRTVALWPTCPKCGQRRSVRCPICHRLGDLFPPADADFWNGVDETPGRFPESKQPKGEHSCHCGGGCQCGHGHSEPADGVIDTPDTGRIDASSLTFGDTGVLPGLEKPAWNFQNMEKQPEPASRETYSFDEKSTWEVPGEKTPESAPQMNAASDAAYTARTFSVSTPNYHRSQMSTIDMEKAETPEELAQKFSKQGIRLVTCPTCDEPFVPKYLPRCKGCGYSFDGAESSEEDAESEEYDPYEEAPAGRVITMSIFMVVLTIVLVLFCIYFVK